MVQQEQHEEQEQEQEQQHEQPTVSNRIRWGARNSTGEGRLQKQPSLVRRWQHLRHGSSEKKMSPKRTSVAETEQEMPNGHAVGVDAAGDDGELANKRRIFFNVPLPDDARDEDGRPLFHFARNKIRTAKYTPLTFIPYNLAFQFKTIANNYFGFIIILGVSVVPSCIVT
jgi:phospholipid-translocating ATPase